MNLPAHKKMLSAAAAASVLLLTAACGSSDSEGADPTNSSAPAADGSGDSGESGSSDQAASGDYADGTYEATGSYDRPSGRSEVDVSITLADGVISEVEVTPKAEGTSRQFQEKFVSGISKEVVGKSLDDISVSKVSGSSLTSKGFNAALDEIKSEASA